MRFNKPIDLIRPLTAHVQRHFTEVGGTFKQESSRAALALDRYVIGEMVVRFTAPIILGWFVKECGEGQLNLFLRRSGHVVHPFIATSKNDIFHVGKLINILRQYLSEVASEPHKRL